MYTFTIVAQGADQDLNTPNLPGSVVLPESVDLPGSGLSAAAELASPGDAAPTSSLVEAVAVRPAGVDSLVEAQVLSATDDTLASTATSDDKRATASDDKSAAAASSNGEICR